MGTWMCVLDIVENMKNWDTWDAIVKDLKPYLGEVIERMKKDDKTLIHDFYILELIIFPKVNAEFFKAVGEFRDSVDPQQKAYSDAVADIVKLHHNSDKLDAVLEAQTQLLDFEKDIIREEWRNQHAVETKGDENSVVEDSNMEEYLKAKFTELSNCKAKVDEFCVRKDEICQFSWSMGHLRSYLSYLKSPWINHLTSHDLLNEHIERIKSMMRAEDNSCISTQAKKRHASSEDNIVASSEDNICRPKKPKLYACS